MNPLISTYKSVKSTYSIEKAQQELKGEWVSYFFYRPISFYISALCIHLGFSAIGVTFFSLITTLIIPFLAFYFPSYTPILLGLVFLVLILDCVDGNIARYTQTSSYFGYYLDLLTDIIFRFSIYISIGLLASSTYDQATPLLFHPLTLVLMALSLYLIARLCRTIVNSKLQNKSIEESKFKFTPFDFFSGLDTGFLPFLMIICLSLDQFKYVAIWLVIYSFLDFLTTQFDIFKSIR